jgi:hypothetical protein
VEAKRGVLFLDEISGATPAVQAALLKVALKRYIGDTQLPGGVRILAAANPPNEAACGWELEPPLANRFIHVDVLPPSPTEWGTWLITETGAPVLDRANGESMVRRGWEEEWPMVKGLFKQFIESRPTLLYALPVEGSSDRGRAWPSPRTLEYAARLVTTCRILCIGIEGQAEMVRAAIGTGASVEWLALTRSTDIPSPETVLDGGWVPDPTRLDTANAVYSSVTAYVLSGDTSQKKTRAIKAWGLFDLVAAFAQLLVKGGLGISGEKSMVAAAAPVMGRLGRSNVTQYLAS